MKKNQNGAITILTAITVFTFFAILIGEYIIVSSLYKSQLNSSITIKKIYNDKVNNIDNIYSEVIENAKGEVLININPNGQFINIEQEDRIISTVVKVNNITNRNIGLKCSWNNDNRKEPEDEWKNYSNGDKIQSPYEEPGAYYLWTKVYDKESSKDILTKVSNPFIIGNGLEEKPVSKSTYKWSKVNEWESGVGNTEMNYQIKLDITNKEENIIGGWEIIFETTESLIGEKVSVWESELVKVENNKVTIKNKSWNSNINYGEILSLQFVVVFNKNVELNITNVILNGKKVMKE